MSLKTEVNKCVAAFFSPLKDSRRALKRLTELLVDAIEEQPAGEKPNKQAVRIFRVNKETPLPERSRDTDAGYDIYLPEDTTLESGDKALIDLGIICQAPRGYHFKLVLRSSAAIKRGLRQLNPPGIIDHEFAGGKDVWKLAVENTTHKTVRLAAGDRVAQLLLEKNEEFYFVEQEDRNFAGKSRGGVGSTGR